MVFAYKAAIDDLVACELFGRYRISQRCETHGDKCRAWVNATGVLQWFFNDYPKDLLPCVSKDLIGGHVNPLDTDIAVLKKPKCEADQWGIKAIQELSRRIGKLKQFSQDTITVKTSWLFRFFEDDADEADTPFHKFITVTARPSETKGGKYTYQIHIDRIANYLDEYINNLECLEHGPGKCIDRGQTGCRIKKIRGGNNPAGITEAVGALEFIHIAMLGPYNPDDITRVESGLFANNFRWGSPVPRDQPIVIDVSPDGPEGSFREDWTGYDGIEESDEAELRYRLIVSHEIGVLCRRLTWLSYLMTESKICTSFAVLCDPAVYPGPRIIALSPDFSSAEIAALHQIQLQEKPEWQSPAKKDVKPSPDEPEPSPMGWAQLLKNPKLPPTTRRYCTCDCGQCPNGPEFVFGNRYSHFDDYDDDAGVQIDRRTGKPTVWQRAVDRMKAKGHRS